jgi:hypothetical protein
MEAQHLAWLYEQERIERDYEVQERQQLLRRAARRAETVDWLVARVGDSNEEWRKTKHSAAGASRALRTDTHTAGRGAPFRQLS